MRTIKLVSFTILAVFIALSVCITAWADNADAPGKVNITTLNLDLKDITVKDAISVLFKGTGFKYYIQSDISGQITTLTLKNVTFDQALKAVTDAAGLAYTVEDGTYIIRPIKTENKPQQVSAVSASTQYGAGPAESTGQAQAMPSQQPQAGNQQDVQQALPPTQVVINQTPAPVFYGQPSLPPPDYGYDYPPVYQFGNTRIIGSGISPVVVAGGSPYILGYGPLPPPPPGFVGADVMRFLRSQYYIQSRPFFITPY